MDIKTSANIDSDSIDTVSKLDNLPKNKLPSKAAILHEKIRAEGSKELERDRNALFLSAIAAGLSMGLSLLAKAILQAKLPENNLGFLIENFGYTVGFLIVILAKQQLFTENTVTAVLPVMTDPSKKNFYRLCRLWGIVLIGNIIGTAIAALVLLYLPIAEPSVVRAFSKIGHHVMENSAVEMLTKGMMSGFIIATMVWILSNAENSRITVIFIMSYLIAIGDFTHIIVGSAEIFYLVFTGDIGLQSYLYPFAVPTLVGNIIGGTFIFTLLAHVQIRNDIQEISADE